jgi:hypothetical protein
MAALRSLTRICSKKERREANPMASFGVTSSGSSRHDTLAAVGVAFVALAALAFVLIVLPWVISI